MAQRLVYLERRVCSDPPSSQELPESNGLRGGSILLMVASFESFLSGVFIERIEYLGNKISAYQFDNLPEKLRVHNASATLDIATRKTIYGNSLTKSDRIQKMQDAASAVSQKKIVPRSFGETRANPSSETVKRLFKNIGLDNSMAQIRPVFDSLWGRPETQDFLSEKLDELIRKRNSIAHTATAMGTSRSDLLAYLRFLRHLATSVDQTLAKHITSTLRETIKKSK